MEKARRRPAASPQDRERGTAAGPDATAGQRHRGSISSPAGGAASQGNDGVGPLQALWQAAGVDTLAKLDLTERERADRDLIAADFDRAYYLLTNADVCSAGIEPLHHFLRSGRLEGRRPAHWFDPAFYRAAYPEASDSGLDPFSYYIRFGRSQNHVTSRRHAPARRALDAARPPASRAPADSPDTVMHLHPGVLIQGLRARLAGARGLTVAVSHDRYAESVGGVQLLVASEQASFNALGEAYLHLAPAIPLVTLLPDGPGPHFLDVTVDGTCLGVATSTELLDALAFLTPDLPELRRLVVHCLLGHPVQLVADLHGRLHSPLGAAPEAVFWLHDYESICVGYNLLRNDVAYCGAPPPGSAACRICIYGEERVAHLAAIQALFHAVPFRVAAPSAAALALWQRKAGLPHRSAEVGIVLRVDETGTRRRIGGGAERGSAGNPVRVAFAGHPVVHKGWPAFVQVAAELERSSAYRLFHFSSCGGQGLPGVEHVPVRVSPAAPDAMTSALALAGVDLVLVLSPWPETFCIVASEALAAGADVLTLECSGNVANLVRQTGRGRVFADADGVAAYLTSAQAILDVRARHVAGAEAGRVRLLGATAALPPFADAAPAAGADELDLTGAA